MQDHELIIVHDAVSVQSATVEHILCLVVGCDSIGAFKALPAALSYKGIVCGKAGYNSDKSEAYFKSDHSVAFAVKQSTF